MFPRHSTLDTPSLFEDISRVTNKLVAKRNLRKKIALIFGAEDTFIRHRIVSPPSPPRSGGKGRGEVGLGEQGHEVSAFIWKLLLALTLQPAALFARH